MANFTGQFGVVLLFEKSINYRVKEIAQSLPVGNSLDFDSAHIPHMTFYHSSFEDAEVFPQLLLEEVKKAVPTKELSFSRINIFGGKFVFWHLDRREDYMDAHTVTLFLSTIRSRKAEGQADKEALNLSEKERSNLELYGHPLVNDLWMPHITVGYYPNGISDLDDSYSQVGRAASLAFVQIGEYGTIKKIICELAL